MEENEKRKSEITELNSNIETMDGWTVLKHSSGLAIATYKSDQVSIALTTQMASGVYSNSSVNGASRPLPTNLFTEVLDQSMNIQSNGYTFCQIATINTETLIYRIWSSYSCTIKNTATFTVIGLWK